MRTITIALPDEKFSDLQDLAQRFNVAPAELARAGVEDLLAYPDARFGKTLDDLMTKNAELYRRLAAL